MKIGIVTYFKHSNYGAVLQSYALQKALEEKSVEAYHVDFGDKEPEPKKSPIPAIQKINNNLLKRNSHFKDFRDKYLNIKPYSKELVDATDAFIVGSDQVWNRNIPGWDNRYFLPFSPSNKKNSYAASIGQAVTEKEKDFIWENIKDFKVLSTREKYFDNVPTVLDPTFLLPKTAWEQFVTEKESNYLLLIMIQNDTNLFNKYKKYASDNNLELKIITASYFPALGFNSWSEISVIDWLNLIYNAQKVVTTSFHGLAFSIIFNKNVEVAELGGDLASRNNRLYELQKIKNKLPIEESKNILKEIIECK